MEKMKTKIFFDFEATSVARDADMISVGLVAVTDTDSTNMLGERQRTITTFYAEFTDFNIDKCDDWVKNNIVSKLQNKEDGCGHNRFLPDYGGNSIPYMRCEKIGVSNYLKQWLSQFESVEFWCDYGVIDTPMLIDLIGNWDVKTNEYPEDGFGSWQEQVNWKPEHKIGLPKHLPNINYYDFYDIHTLFKIKGVDTDIDRQGFSEVFGGEIPIIMESTGGKHNALWDAYVTWKCYEKLIYDFK